MRRNELTDKILDIKRAKGWTWNHVAAEIGGLSPILIVGALLGPNEINAPAREKSGGAFRSIGMRRANAW